MKDYNSAGFLTLTLVGLMLAVAGLLLLSDASRSGGEMQIAQHGNPVEIPSRPAKTTPGTGF